MGKAAALLRASSVRLRKAASAAYDLFSLEPANLIAALLFAAAFFSKTLAFHRMSGISAGPYLSGPNLYMLIITAGTFLAFMALPYAISPKRAYITLAALDILVSALLFSDIMFYKYYHNLLSTTVLHTIGVVDSFLESVIGLVRPKDLIYFWTLPIALPALAILFHRRRKAGKAGSVPAMRRRERILIGRKGLRALILRAAPVAVLAAASLLVTRYGLGKANTHSFRLDNIYVAQNAGIMYFHLRDVRDFALSFLEDKTPSPGEVRRVEDFYAAKRAPQPNAYTGIASGKDVIVIQLEAIMGFVIGFQVNGNEVTPNMNRLAREHASFGNIYYQVADGNTSDAEFVMHTSIHPINSGSVFVMYADNEYPSIGRELKAAGYGTYAFHANRPSFWNRTVMYDSLAFDRFFSRSDYTMEEEGIGWGVSDRSFLLQSVFNAVHHAGLGGGRPLYMFMVTLSSHFPYRYDYSSLGYLDVGERYQGTLMGSYLKAAHYVDRCIGKLEANLRERGLWDETVLMIYGDHYAFPIDRQREFCELLGVEDSEFQWYVNQRTPLIIKCPGIEGYASDKVGATIDLYPTLANLLGIGAPYAMGHDLFGEGGGYALLRNLNVVTPESLYLSEQRNVYDRLTGAPRAVADYDADMAPYVEEFEVSQLITRKDVFRHMPGYGG